MQQKYKYWNQVPGGVYPVKCPTLFLFQDLTFTLINYYKLSDVTEFLRGELIAHDELKRNCKMQRKKQEEVQRHTGIKKRTGGNTVPASNPDGAVRRRPKA